MLSGGVGATCGGANTACNATRRFIAHYSHPGAAEPGYRDSRSYILDTDRWRQQLTAGGFFTDVTVDIIEWHQTLTPQTARDLWSTFPNIAELPPPAHAQFLDRLGAIIDDLGGTVEDPRLTVLYAARRSGQPA